MSVAGSWLFPHGIRTWLALVGEATFGNPYSPDVLALDAQVLPHDELASPSAPWRARGPASGEQPNAPRIRWRLRSVVDAARTRLAAGTVPSEAELRLYEDACLHLLLGDHGAALAPFVDPKPAPPDEGGEPQPERPARGRRPRGGNAAPATPPGRGLSAADRAAQAAAYAAFLQDYEALLVRPCAALRPVPPERLFARCFQVQRALHFIGSYLVGRSPAMVRLRMRLWEAIFTIQMRETLLGEDDCMDDMHTLVLGESGTGKELVAQAIGRTGPIPFLLGERCFAAADGEHYHCLSLVERTATLIQAELFGYDAGAFTGAERDTPGWLELCVRGGRLFLDEIGELEVSLQPMLLRVLQSRTFLRQGSRLLRNFHGRVVAATNQDLRALIAAGKFRGELFQRLAVDEIQAPPLRVQLKDAPGDLEAMVLHVAVKVLGPELGARLAAKAMDIILQKRGPSYAWPGNFRELERTVRRIYIHDKDLASSRRLDAAKDDAATALGRAIQEGHMTMAEIERRAVLTVFRITKSRRKGALMLDIDRDRFAKRLQEALDEDEGKDPPDT